MFFIKLFLIKDYNNFLLNFIVNSGQNFDPCALYEQAMGKNFTV